MTTATATPDVSKYHYLTLRHGRGPFAGVDVLGWGTYPRGSVLEGQASKSFLDNLPDEATARAKYPTVQGFSSQWTEPQVNLAHLPGEDDPVAGGMYPDDIY